MKKLMRLFKLLILVCVLSTSAMALPAAPELAAKSYLLIDFNTGQVIVQKDPDKRVEPASITKLMSCLLYTSPSPRDATLSRMPSSA